MLAARAPRDAPDAVSLVSRAPVRVAHIMPWPGVGGTETSTLRIARAIEGFHFRNVMFCLHEAKAVRKLFEDSGLETTTYEAPEPSYRHAAAFVRSSLRIARDLRRRKISIVHCADLLAGYTTGLAGRLAGVPILCHVRNPHDSISLRDRSFLRFVDKFVFVSRYTREHFAYRIRERRAAIVYDGIDIVEVGEEQSRRRLHQEFGIPRDVKVVGMVARIAPQKDHSTFVKAAARIVAEHPRVHFVMVGDYEATAVERQHYEEIERMVKARNLGAYFTFTGLRSDVAHLLRGMDVVVLCTHFEGFGLVVIEAMAQERPVVATGVGGVLEIVVDGSNGLLHRPGDDEQLAAQVVALLRDQHWARRLAVAGRRDVESRFTARRFATDMCTLYRTILDRR